MKHLRLRVPWNSGLHLRPASRLVALAREFRSSIRLKANGRIADARSILSILLLNAAIGTAVEIEASGDDEDLVVDAVETLFSSNDGTLDGDDDPAS